MITDEQFKDYINKIGDQYEVLKDLAIEHCNMDGVLSFYGKLAEFRDIACTALRESHTNKKFEDN